jgi:voltage-gated potassium channel
VTATVVRRRAMAVPIDASAETPTLPRRTLKARLYELLEGEADDDRLTRAFDFAMVLLIAVNVVAVILESVERFEVAFEPVFRWIEIISVMIFTAEYAARLWTCTEDDAYREPIRGRLRFAMTPLALIDLLAIVPFYSRALDFDLRMLRVLRMLRLLRVLKVGRYSEALTTIWNVIRAKKEELAMSILVILLLMVLGSGLLYVAEKEAQPGAFESIPAAMWWATVFLSSADFNDVRPITSIGQLLGVALALLNVGLLAIPTGILGSGFAEEFRRRRGVETCRACGTPVSRDLGS